LRFTPPRRPQLDILELATGGGDGLTAAAAAGYPLALLSCTDGTALGLPPHSAALLTHTESGWIATDIWPYPEVATKERWSSLSGAPLCHS
jgi:hypothetical protein